MYTDYRTSMVDIRGPSVQRSMHIYAMHVLHHYLAHRTLLTLPLLQYCSVQSPCDVLESNKGRANIQLRDSISGATGDEKWTFYHTSYPISVQIAVLT